MSPNNNTENTNESSIPDSNVQAAVNFGKIKKYLGVFTPSAIGMVIYVSTMVFVIVLQQFDSISESLEVPSVNFLQTIVQWLDKFLNATIGQSTTETLVVGLFWAVVGLGVYIFLRGIARFLTEISESYEDSGNLWPRGVDPHRPIVEAAERIIVRIMAFLVLMVIVFGPLAAIFSGPIWVNFIGPNPWMQLLFWLPVGILTMHICVVLIRLVAFRARLLG